MTAWKTKSLSEVVSLQRGHDLPTDERIPGTIPIIGSFGITGYHNTAKQTGPGVAIGRSGASIGKATYVKNEFWPLNTCLFATDFHGNDPFWIYLMLSLIDFTGFNSGSAQPSLNRNIIAGIPVAVPPLPEQRAIAEVLGALDDKIAANRKLVTTIDDLMVALVTGLEADTPLSDLADLRKSSVQPDGMPVTVSHYSLPVFDEGALPGHELSATIKSGKFSFNHPAVLLSKLNPRFPRIWNVPEPEDNAVASTEFLVLEPKDMSTSTLWALLSTSRVSNFLQEHVSGTTGSHQRFKPAQAMQMPMPGSVPVDLQKSLTSLGDRAVAARHESQTLARLRDTLLPALMDGTIRVKDAEKLTEEAI